MIDIECLCQLFDMYGSATFKLSKDIKDYNKNKALKFLFPNNPLNVVTIKVMSTRLLMEDRLLPYTIVKCILL